LSNSTKVLVHELITCLWFFLILFFFGSKFINRAWDFMSFGGSHWSLSSSIMNYFPWLHDLTTIICHIHFNTIWLSTSNNKNSQLWQQLLAISISIPIWLSTNNNKNSQQQKFVLQKLDLVPHSKVWELWFSVMGKITSLMIEISVFVTLFWI